MSGPSELSALDPPTVGRYRLLGRLGTGGQGTVYLATDDGPDPVAIKVLNTRFEDAGRLKVALNRELASAQSVAAFVTAQVIMFDLDADPPYVVTEYVEGPTLYEEVRTGRGALRGSRLADVAIQTVIALEAIHAANVIHCDFKPGNIILGPGGVKVIDFGIARAWEEVDQAASRVIGSAHFMAPEQIDNRPLGPPADMFAWAATMVYAATGQNAFPGANPVAVGLKVVQDEPELHGLDGPLAGLVRACLRKDPAQRPTAAQVREALMAPAAPRSPAAPAAFPAPPPQRAPVPAAPQPAPFRATPAAPRRRGWAGPMLAAVVVLLMLAAGGAGYFWWSRDTTGAPAPQPTAEDRDLAALQAFAGDRSLAGCAVIPPNDKQLLRRSCTTGGVVATYSLFKPGEREKERANVARLSEQGPDELERGTGTSPDERQGEYIEYTYEAKDDGRTYAAVWWDDGITNPDGAGVVTMRQEWDQGEDDPARDLREAWTSWGYRLDE